MNSLPRTLLFYDPGAMAAPQNDDWIARTRARVSDISEQVTSTDVSEMNARLLPIVSAIDAPADPWHAAWLTLLLIDVCHQILEAVHHRQSSDETCACHRYLWTRIAEFTRATDRDPRDSFREWLDAFGRQWNREHAPAAAERAAALMRADPANAWRLRELSRATGAPSARLRHSFIARYGLRPSAYLQLVRVARAVDLFRAGTKVEAIAWDVGYRSKKDLYGALKRWVGATPTELRALPDCEREWLLQQLRARCLSGEDSESLYRGVRRARNIKYASVPPTSAAPPMSATPE